MAEDTPNPTPENDPDGDQESMPESNAGETPTSGGDNAQELADDLLASATAASNAAQAIAEETGAPQAFEMPEFGGNGTSTADDEGPLSLLDDVDLKVTVELGRTSMLVEDVLRLNEHSVIELDRAAGDPVDIYVNGRHVARGEVLVVNENFCVRVNEIIPCPGIEEQD